VYGLPLFFSLTVHYILGITKNKKRRDRSRKCPPRRRLEPRESDEAGWATTIWSWHLPRPRAGPLVHPNRRKYAANSQVDRSSVEDPLIIISDPDRRSVNPNYGSESYPNVFAAFNIFLFISYQPTLTRVLSNSIRIDACLKLNRIINKQKFLNIRK
jgi:hypothetical protein